jgi:hypothetical protein
VSWRRLSRANHRGLRSTRRAAITFKNVEVREVAARLAKGSRFSSRRRLRGTRDGDWFCRGRDLTYLDSDQPPLREAS